MKNNNQPKTVAELGIQKWDFPDSSNIKELKYYPKSKRLRVKFKYGKHYEYQGVTKEELEQIINADSVGSTFNDIIVKSSKEYSKL